MNDNSNDDDDDTYSIRKRILEIDCNRKYKQFKCHNLYYTSDNNFFSSRIIDAQRQ